MWNNNKVMIENYREEYFEELLAVINDAAMAYKGVIPVDCWREPYMSVEALKSEIDSGVSFSVSLDEEGKILGVMGVQPAEDVVLIRHAYVRTKARRRGIGSKLISVLQKRNTKPILVGTWAAAYWAIDFYEKHGFSKQGPEMTSNLLKKYWSVPDRQARKSVVLADQSWLPASPA